MQSFFGAYFNLLKTSIGSGVLNFPYLYKTYGLVTASIFTFVIGFLATFGLFLLTLCSQDIGRAANYHLLSVTILPYSSQLVNIAVFLKCFGVALSYVIITRDLIPDIIDGLGYKSSFFSNPTVNLFIFLGLVGPFAYFNKLDKLKYTSFVGVFSIFLVILAALYRYLVLTTQKAEIFYFLPYSSAWITNLGKFIFSFTCHQNIFSVYSEIRDNSLSSMKRVIASVALSSLTLYLSFGIINYAIYGDKIDSNILKTYPNDILATFAKILYVAVLGVSYPLQMIPARIYLMNIFGLNPTMKGIKMIIFIVSTALIVSTYAIAVSGINLGMVYSIVGSTASAFMCLIFPAIFYLYSSLEKSYFSIAISYAMFLLGIFIFCTTIISLLMGNLASH